MLLEVSADKAVFTAGNGGIFGRRIIEVLFNCIANFKGEAIFRD